MSIFYEQGKTAAFEKLGLNAEALHQLGNAMPSIGRHALGGGVLGAGAGYAASDEGHGLRGALIGGALGGVGGATAGAVRHPTTQHGWALRNHPEAFNSWVDTAMAHKAGPVPYQEAMATHASKLKDIDDPAMHANFAKLVGLKPTTTTVP